MQNYFDLSQPDLRIENLKAQELAERYGTPLYLYSAAIFAQKYKKLRAALPAPIEIFFAMKSNPSLAIVNLFRRLGAGADIASLGELQTALKAALPPQKIVFSGPGKSERELEAALRAEIFSINAESERELERIQRIAQQLNKRVRVGLRLNVPFAPGEQTAIIGGAAPHKFGIDLARAPQAVRLAQSLKNLELSGIHIFNASNVLDAAALVANAERIFATALGLARETGFALGYIDLGGGLGIPYSESESELDVAALGRGLSQILKAYTEKGLCAATRILVEPGRYLTAEAGVYLTRVLDLKETRGVRFIIVDGGVHHLLRPTWFSQAHPVRVANKLNRPRTERYSIAGPLCTALDYLAKDVKLPAVEVGDLLTIFAVGAYGFTESMPYFLSHPTPAEVLIWEGKDYEIRRRQSPEEYWAHQSVPDGLS